MTNNEFEQLLALHHELRGIEFKGPGERTDRAFFAQVVRAILGMANIRDGGVVVIGVEDTGTSLNATGLSDEELVTWRYDDVADGLARYADPSVSFELETLTHDGSSFVVLTIAEFNDIPVLCKRSYQPVLRDGACYVRTRRKPETSEIPTQADMRDLLDLATEKALRKFIVQAQRAGILPTMPEYTDDDERFNEQLGDLL